MLLAEDFRDELRQVFQEMSAERHPELQSVAHEPPRHLSGANPSKVVRWLEELSELNRRPQRQTFRRLPNKVSMKPTTTVTDSDRKRRHTVLPKSANDPASTFYEFSLADAVITELARVRSLVVRPSSVIARYQGQQRDPRERSVTS